MTGADAARGTPGIAEIEGIGIEETVTAEIVATGTGMTETVTAEAAGEEGMEEAPMAPPQPKMG
jgi:hypothetical protein